MKKGILIICCFYAFTSFRNTLIDMNQVRALYKEAANNENSCEKLIEISAGSANESSLILGYKASGMLIMAKHVFSPFSKMTYFKKGKQMLEKAITSDKNDIELRFLRFTAQTNMPFFLGYSGSIESDKQFILHSFPHIKDIELKKFMMPVLRESKYLTDKEKQQLN
ncbi:MAG TPA: hypothetical protein VIJ57_03660 [Hanamia sp.]